MCSLSPFEVLAEMSRNNKSTPMKALQFFKTPEGEKYLKEFHNEIFVIKYGGAALEDPSMMDYFLEDVAAMKSHGIQVVLIHGGGKALTQKMEERDLEVKFVEGIRQTSPQAVKLAQEVFAQINHTICQRLNELGCQTQPLTHGRSVIASLIDPTRPENRVGKVEQILSDLIDTPHIPVLSSIGQSIGAPKDPLEKGELLNINADTLAIHVASALKARKIIYISDIDGIYIDINDPSTKLSHVTEREIEELIDKGVIHGGMQLKIRTALEGLKKGVRKVHFINGSVEHSLMIEIFTDRGIGTEIVHDE